MSKEIPKSHNGVLPILDQMWLRSIADILGSSHQDDGVSELRGSTSVMGH